MARTARRRDVEEAQAKCTNLLPTRSSENWKWKQAKGAGAGVGGGTGTGLNGGSCIFDAKYKAAINSTWNLRTKVKVMPPKKKVPKKKERKNERRQKKEKSERFFHTQNETRRTYVECVRRALENFVVWFRKFHAFLSLDFLAKPMKKKFHGKLFILFQFFQSSSLSLPLSSAQLTCIGLLKIK